MAVVLAPIVAQHGVGAIAAVTVLAGLLVLTAGVTRPGACRDIHPVAGDRGFTLGIAAIIFPQQVPAAFGTTAPAGHRTLTAAWTVITTPTGRRPARRWPSSDWSLMMIGLPGCTGPSPSR